MVYVTQEVAGKNIAAAQRFGQLKFLLPADSQVLDTEACCSNMYSKLQAFSDTDYLLLIGDPVAIALASAIASECNRGKMKLLKWDKQIHDYFVVEIRI